MIFNRIPSFNCDPQMSALERNPSAFSRRSLFSSSSQNDDFLPSEHRSSVIDVDMSALESTGTRLTSALLESHPQEFKQATETPFLRQAGRGKITKLQLSKWLSQDRLYAETYVCFISSLIARVSLPYAYVPDKSRSLRWRILNLLTGALQNIQRELEFFATTARDHDLVLDQPFHDDDKFQPEEATTQYVDIFQSFVSDPSLPLIEGMVTLWATEKCYLSAWSYASRFTKDAEKDSPAHDADGGALREKFIPNWTSEDFAAFVDEIAELTDLLGAREQAVKKLEVYKAVWLHVLDIEKRFWLSVDE